MPCRILVVCLRRQTRRSCMLRDVVKTAARTDDAPTRRRECLARRRRTDSEGRCLAAGSRGADIFPEVRARGELRSHI
jgi:hypothetical protein